MYTHHEMYHGEVFGSQNSELSLGFASFFVSPARHGEAQDMSGTWKRKNN